MDVAFVIVPLPFVVHKIVLFALAEASVIVNAEFSQVSSFGPA